MYIPLTTSVEHLEWYVGISELILVTGRVAAYRDPKDVKILSLALSAQAGCRIVGDSDLRAMVAFAGIPIHRPTDFQRLFVAQWLRRIRLYVGGALGRCAGQPIGFLVAEPGWRWMLGRKDTPWYPSVRMRRQQAADQWACRWSGSATANFLCA
jgi:hypothetical protein